MNGLTPSPAEIDSRLLAAQRRVVIEDAPRSVIDSVRAAFMSAPREAHPFASVRRVVAAFITGQTSLGFAGARGGSSAVSQHVASCEQADITFEARPGALGWTLDGIVLPSDDDALCEVEMTLVRVEGDIEHVVAGTTSSLEGDFRFAAVADGDYRICALVDGLEIVSEVFVLGGSGETPAGT